MFSPSWLILDDGSAAVKVLKKRAGLSLSFNPFVAYPSPKTSLPGGCLTVEKKVLLGSSVIGDAGLSLEGISNGVYIMATGVLRFAPYG